MTDKYESLRDAVNDFESGDLNGRDWIVLANPGTIRALLADYDRMLEALEHLINRANDSNGACYGTLSTSFVRDTARAALAQEQGGSDGAHSPHN